MKTKIVSKIKRKGYPENTKDYPEAHSEASNQEKKKFPVGYKKLKMLDKKIPQGEMIGGHTKSGKVTVSKKVPKGERREVAYHERIELKDEKRLQKKHRNK
jgi:hypothetical protein